MTIVVKMGANIDLKTETFAFIDSSRFKGIDWCKFRITELALFITEHLFIRFDLISNK